MAGELTPLQKERRNKILLAAANYFAAVHFHEADIEQIAREAGVGKGTIYRYFKNKDDLYVQAIEHQLELAMQYIHQQAAQSKTLVEYMETIITSAVNYFVDNPVAFNMVLLSNTVRVETVADVVNRIRTKYFQTFDERFWEGVHQGVFKPLNSRMAMRILDASILHLVYDLRRHQHTTKDDIIHNLKEIYLNGILQ
jgi:AcrR family transcriptional regulator